ncbi:AsmA family protein [Tenacibaculum dicentrarchi]|nr:AsmA family protein [Tenacibaculum dicentrarchi]MCD8419569.1 AsmA family protein [Tenacibaculum dicentrarchi]MCD8433729.1 AsmA family protein [Tenacibaculum dicentrarchi]MCD8436098.1 AsmA family protein [Tenacibaculum dicentrarchi]MCD8451378.1 AsmA family protein [Tenacibaculum dicentrarchi]
MKKTYKILLTIFVTLLMLLILTPFLFQDKIITLVKKTINNNITAKLDFSNSNLSLFRDFPNASVQLSNVSIINKKPFEGDTLLFAKKINLELKLTELFKKTSEQLNIQSFSIDDANVTVLVNEIGVANYDIAKPSDVKTENTDETPSNFGLSINSYAINNALIKYHDKKGKLKVKLTDFNHSGSGDFSQKKSELNTNTSTLVSFEMDGASYAKNQKITLDAILGMDLVNSKFSFLKNEAKLNNLPLIFDGYVQINDNNQEIDLNFKTPSSDFKNFLGLVPKTYTKSIENVKTSGDFSVAGTVKGLITNKKIPLLDISLKSNNASFKYPDLPKSVRDINIDVQLKNTSGYLNKTFVDINKLSFKIDEDVFSGNGKAYNITTNPTIDAKLNGTLNLANINKAYPVDLENELQGILKANLHTKFDLKAIENNTLSRIKNNGNIELNDFVYASKDIVNSINIKNSNVSFTPAKITLNKFNATTGKSDLNATGNINNLLGFLLADKKLQGTFNLKSNAFHVSDFMQESTDDNQKEEENTKKEQQPDTVLKIPAFLDCKILADAKTVYYDNLTLKNVKGTLLIKDEKAILQNVNANMFKGQISFNGEVNTKEKTPVFNMNLGMKSFDISESFNGLDLLKSISPIATALSGKLNSDINLSGNLNGDFTPDLASVSGKALAELLSTKIEPKNSKALSLLNNKLSFLDLSKLDLSDIKTQLSFDKGQVSVKPFKLKYKDININVGGNHSFDQKMNYNVTLDVPAKYLGSEVQGLLSKVSAKDQNTTVPITANITGNMKNPAVKTDLSSSVTKLSQKLIQQQKDNLINSAISKVSESKTIDKINTKLGSKLGNLLGNKKTDTTKTSTTKTETVKKVKDVLGGLFGKKKK